MAIHVSGIKIIAMFSTLVCAFFGAYIPWKLRKQGGSKGASFISNGAMLSGGVFVGVGFLHLLGDAVEDMQSFKHSHHGYPFSMLCASVGFLFTLCIDELGHALAHSTAVLPPGPSPVSGLDRGGRTGAVAHGGAASEWDALRPNHEAGQSYQLLKSTEGVELNLGRGSTIDGTPVALSPGRARSASVGDANTVPVFRDLEDGVLLTTPHGHALSVGLMACSSVRPHTHTCSLSTAHVRPVVPGTRKSLHQLLQSAHLRERQADDSDDDSDAGGRTKAEAGAGTGAGAGAGVGAGYGSNDVVQAADDCDRATLMADFPSEATVVLLPKVKRSARKPQSNRLTSIIVTFIFSFHSLFAGLALGIDSSTTSILETLGAILAHKSLATFALGVALLRGNMTKPSQYITTMTTFSFTTPLGIIVGILVQDFETPTWLAISFSVAAGTFLYVGIIEMIVKELKPKNRVLSPSEKATLLAYMLLGYTVMAVVSYWT